MSPLLLLLACAEAEAPTEACTPSSENTWATFGASFMAGRCSGCHGSGSPNRHGAPESVVFDDEADVWALRATILDSVTTRAAMPPAGGLTEVELTRLQSWLACEP